MTDVAIPPRGARSNSTLAVVDQGIVSLASLLYTVAVARESSLQGFGAFALINGYYFLAISLNRAGLAVPVTLALAAGNGERERAGAIAFAPLMGLLLATPLAVGAVVWSDSSWATVALLTGLLLPVACLQDVGRYAQIASRRAGAAVLADAAWVIVQLVGLFAASEKSGPVWPTVCWLAGGIAAACVTLRTLSPLGLAALGGLRTFIDDRRRRVALVAEAAVNMGSGYAAMAVVAAMSLTAAGSVRAGITLLSPASVVVAGLVPAVLSEGTRLQARPKRQVVVIGTLAAAALGLVLVLVVTARLIPSSVGTALLGDAWQGGVSTVAWLGVATVMYTAVTCVVILVTVRGHADKAFLLRLMGTVPIPIVLAVASSPDPTVTALMWAVGSGVGLLLVTATAWRNSSWRSLRG